MTPSVSTATSWSIGINAVRLREAVFRLFRRVWSADKMILELLTSEYVVVALFDASFSAATTGPKISITFPAAARIPTIDAAALRGSMEMEWK